MKPAHLAATLMSSTLDVPQWMLGGRQTGFLGRAAGNPMRQTNFGSAVHKETPNMQSTEASSWVLVTVHPAGAGLLRALGRDVGTRKSGSQARAGCGRCGPRSQKFSAGSKFKDSLFAAVSSSPTLETARCSHKLLSRLLDLVVRR